VRNLGPTQRTVNHFKIVAGVHKEIMSAWETKIPTQIADIYQPTAIVLNPGDPNCKHRTLVSEGFANCRLCGRQVDHRVRPAKVRRDYGVKL